MLHDADPLLILSLVIVAGLLGGALTRRLGVAGVTGQILVGIALGRAGLDLFPHEAVADLAPVTHFALGLIALVVGGHLNLRRLRNARARLGLLLLAEVTITPLLVYVCVVAAGHPWTLALLFAALSVSTAPATVVALVSETKSRGVFTKTLMGTVALDNIACIALFEVAHVVAHTVALDAAAPLGAGLLLEPLRELIVAVVLGGLTGALLVLVTRRVIRSQRLATASVISVMLVSGLAMLLDVSQLLACLVLGMALANLTPDKDEIVESAFVNVRDAIFAVFFTLAGMHLDLGALGAGGALVLLVFVARAAGKLLSAHLALRLAGATRNLRRWLGLALIPQAGVAVGLLLLVQDDPVMGDVSPLLLSVGLAVVTLNELVGPILGRLALQRSGDAGADRARLIDFLHEENIVTDLRASTKEEAIEQLVDVLIGTNRLDADRDALLASVLARESEMSTCFGSGLAVPHGILPHGASMVGAMGISREGLPLDTPDGRPVHCMVVLATPENERDRHLQVLAALAKSVGTDPVVRRQLFAAASPAHAYEILHAKDAEGFNYYLDDEPAVG
ncbi:MAG: cation:proton antiporter [Planctomycetes bacterium]|nr:cation:proton antiporter [Planctomycetota bacterium]